MKDEKFNLTDFHLIKGRNVIICYKGPFYKEILDILGSDIRRITSRKAASGTKLFRVFMELSRNISLYSAEKIGGRSKDTGMGSLVLVDYSDHFQFITGNLINNEDIAKVMERCGEINGMDKDRLRKLKREHLSNVLPEREGADIGLIQLAITSENPIEIKTVKAGRNRSFITIAVRLDK